MLKKNNLEVVKIFIQYQKTGLLKKALSLIDDDAIWYSDSINAPWSGNHRGKEAIEYHFTNVIQSVLSFNKTQYDIVSSQNTNYVYEYGFLECKFAHNSEYFSTNIVSIYEVSDGKIKSYRVLEDSNSLYKKYHLKRL